MAQKEILIRNEISRESHKATSLFRYSLSSKCSAHSSRVWHKIVPFTRFSAVPKRQKCPAYLYMSSSLTTQVQNTVEPPRNRIKNAKNDPL